jgi:hypothetical protein
MRLRSTRTTSRGIAGSHDFVSGANGTGGVVGGGNDGGQGLVRYQERRLRTHGARAMAAVRQQLDRRGQMLAGVQGTQWPDLAPQPHWALLLDRRLIDLPPANSKNKRRKPVEIPENLAAWLTPQTKTEGSIMPRAKVQVAMANCVDKAGIEWPHNCLRHPFCSRAVALHGFTWTSLQADHSERMLRITIGKSLRNWKQTPTSPFTHKNRLRNTVLIHNNSPHAFN